MNLKIVYNDDLIKIKFLSKMKIKSLLAYLAKTLNISGTNKLILLRNGEKLSENDEISEVDQKLSKDQFLLLEEIDYQKKDNKLKEKLKDGMIQTSNTSHKSQYHMYQSQSNKLKNMAERIKACTGGKEDINVVPQRRRRQREVEEESDYLRMLIQRMIGVDSLNDSELEEFISEDESDNSLIDGQSLSSNDVEVLENHNNPVVHNNSQRRPIFQVHRVDQNPFQSQNNSIGNRSNNNVFQNSNRNNIQIIDRNDSRRRPINYDPVLLERLLEMGFEAHNCRIALRLARNNLEHATHILLNAPDMIFIENEDLAVDNIVNNAGNHAGNHAVNNISEINNEEANNIQLNNNIPLEDNNNSTVVIDHNQSNLNASLDNSLEVISQNQFVNNSNNISNINNQRSVVEIRIPSDQVANFQAALFERGYHMISYRLPPNESYSQSEIDPYEYPAQDDSDDDGDLL